MKNLILLLTCLAMLMSCNNQNGTKETVTPAKDLSNVNVDIVTDSIECESAEDTTYRETLNDIRDVILEDAKKEYNALKEYRDGFL